MTASREHVYRIAQVVRVVDGDTLWARVDVGFRFLALVNLRLAGIDCPETHKGSAYERAKAAEAKALALAFLAGHGWLWAATEPDPDDFGRWLADVWAETPTGAEPVVEHLADQLLAAGLATRWPTRWRDVYDPPPPH